MSSIEGKLLGPVRMTVDGRSVDVTSIKQRAILAVLLMGSGRVVAVDALIDAVWGERPPDRAEHTLQQHVSGLRKAVAPVRAPADAPIIETRSPGYLLRVDHLDTHEFERASADASAAATDGRWDDAAAACDRALDAWEGHDRSLADVRTSARLEAAATRLDEQRLGVIEARCEARLACGQARALVPELEHLVAEHPLRERLRGQLMLALYRSGRQADALAVFQAARRTLLDELGIEPSTELRDLEQAVLLQSPRLDLIEAPRDASTRPMDIHATYQADARVDLGSVELPDGQVVHLPAGRSIIGRDPGALIRLVDNRASRTHATIEAGPEGCILRDQGSSNGTTVNGTPISEHRLSDGDRISAGGVGLRFRGPR